jgi:hypothetical protein
MMRAVFAFAPRGLPLIAKVFTFVSLCDVYLVFGDLFNLRDAACA